MSKGVDRRLADESLFHILYREDVRGKTESYLYTVLSLHVTDGPSPILLFLILYVMHGSYLALVDILHMPPHTNNHHYISLHFLSFYIASYCIAVC